MKNLILLMIIVLGLFISSCGTLATKSKLPQISLDPLTEKKGSIVYRFHVRSLKVERVRLDYREKYSSFLKQVLVDSNYFINVDEFPKKLNGIELKGSLVEPEENLALKISFPIQADYFLDVEAEENKQEQDSYESLTLIHVITLGFFPMFFNNEVKIKATLYDRNGIKLAEQVSLDKNTIWAWTPLILFNGFRVFPSSESLHKPIRQNTFRHTIQNFWK